MSDNNEFIEENDLFIHPLPPLPPLTNINEIDNSEKMNIINNTYKMENNLISNNQMNGLIDSMLEKINKKIQDLKEEENEEQEKKEKEEEENEEEDYKSEVEPILNLPLYPDFSFINDDSIKNMISSAYECVMIKNAWECIKSFRGESFMFCKDYEINKLMDFIDSRYECGHSGCSIGLTMRQLQLISNIGFDNYKNEWINKCNK